MVRDTETPDADDATDPGSDTVEDIFAECFGRSEADWRAAFDAACAQHPEHADELRRRWSLLAGAAMAPPAGLPPADRLGKFRLVEPLGSGGMGVVYLAVDESLGRRVALKLIRPELIRREKALQRFRREVEAASRLDDPGICTVYEAGEIDGWPFLSMRYVEGETLEERIRARRERASSRDGSNTTSTRDQLAADVALVEQVARSLHTAHEQGLVHRDVKPGNIMITSDETPVLLDFGLVLTAEADDVGLTLSGEVLGTPLYMAPEQIEPKGRAVDRRTDVYALGVTLYELLTTRCPFEGASLEALSRRILSGVTVPVTRFNPRIDGELAVVVATAMDIDPSRRYRTALAFADDLRRVLERQPIAARPASFALRARRWVQRNPAVASVLLLLAVSSAVMSWLYAFAADSYAASRRLADEYRLAERVQAARSLWPAAPAQVPALEAWLASVRDFPAMLTFHRERLARERPAVGGDVEDRWLHDHRAELVAQFERFVDDPAFDGGLRDVERRLGLARTLRARSVEAHRAAWDRACAAVAADERFHGFALRPQTGLVPLGPDQATGLEEFAHLPSGSVPARALDTGRLVLAEDSAIVLVLVPGGRVMLGASPRGETNVDPDAQKDETPFVVELAPFFVGKHELTQAQWQRVAHVNPSHLAPPRFATPLHPVERVTHDAAVEVLARLGLELPTEAQWEHAARGGTSTPFWCERDRLARGANFADETLHASNPDVACEIGLSDGFGGHAPVDALMPNGFGLCHVLGNVNEWCLDRYAEQRVPEHRRGSGEAVVPAGPGRLYRVYRGGSYYQRIVDLRVSRRWFYGPADAHFLIGVRAARAVDPPKID